MKEFFVKIKTWWLGIPRKTILGKIIYVILTYTGKFTGWLFASEVMSIALSVVIFKKVSSFWGIILFCISVYLLILAIHRTETK